MAEILVRRDGAVGLVVISNVPKHNALTPEMCLALGTALEELEADATVRVIAIVGDGERAFVSGADIGQFEKMKDQAAIEPPYMLPLRCEKPVIACVRGICMGGGLGLAAACDIRIGSDRASFGMPEVRVGTPSVIYASLLPGLIGAGAARWLLRRTQARAAGACAE